MLPADKDAKDLTARTTFKASKRQRQILFSDYESAAQAIGPLEPGCEIVVMSKGQFSLIHALDHVLRCTGPARVNIATWTAASGDIRQAEAWLQSAAVNGLRFVVDPSFKSRKPQFCQSLVDTFGDDAIRTVRIHAKFATIENDAWHIALRTSMNLNPNTRIEMLEISDDAALTGFLADFVDDVFDRDTAGADRDQTRGRFDKIRHPHSSNKPLSDLPF